MNIEKQQIANLPYQILNQYTPSQFILLIMVLLKNFRTIFIAHLSLLTIFQVLYVSIAEIGSPRHNSNNINSVNIGLLPVELKDRVPILLDDIPKNRIGELEPSIGFYQAIEMAENSLLFAKQSKYQAIEVHQSKFFGKMLVLDGVIQLTERDADSYNEMMAHVPMFQHKNPKRVLVIGGGDGYVLKEVLKHHSVVHVDHVDLDGEVITTCEKHFPQWGDAWKDPRAHLHICDGAQFVRDTPDNTYDVIIQDSSDPWIAGEDGVMQPLPSGTLYEREHICELFRVLKPEGIVNIQAESFNVPTSLDGIVSWRKNMEECGFTRSRYGNIQTSSYPTGQIGLLIGEKNPSIASDMASVLTRYNNIVENGEKTTYYHPPLQRGCFDLPLWVHNTIYGVEDTSDLLCNNDDDRKIESTEEEC